MALGDATERPDLPDRPRWSTAERTLFGSRCRDCDTRSWPGRAICHRCGSARLEDIPLADAGTLQTYTTVHVQRPGLEVPYILGQVLLDDGVRLYAHVRGLADDARVPLRVRVCFAPDEAALPIFWFEPDSAAVAPTLPT